MQLCLMRRWIPGLATLACAVILIGCTPKLSVPGPTARPVVATKWPGSQQEADATLDWENVARQIAWEMSERGLLPATTPTVSAPTDNPPYYVNVTGPASQFLHEARQSLQAEILRRGGSVSASPVGAATINLTSDLVYWPSAYGDHDGAPASEVAWEASITSGDRVVFDVRYPMYVSSLDAALYTDPPAPPVGPPMVQLRYAR
jgi:hypothetical protein